MKESAFKAYLSKLHINNKSNSKSSSQEIKIILNDISISDHDLTVLKNIHPESKINVKIQPADEQLSLGDIEETRKENEEEKYNVR